MHRFEKYINWMIDTLVAYFPRLISAIITLIIGLLIIKLFRRIIKNIMTKREDHDPTLLKFILDVVTWVFRVLLFVSVITKLGVETTSFVAAIGAAGLAIGLSLQGSLSNFAGGLLIIMFKPFRVGDYVEAQGQAGTVSAIQIFSTRIITPNNQVIYLPNGALSNGAIKNFSTEENRRAELVIAVDYKSDLKQVKDVLNGIFKSDPKILKSPAPGIEIRDLAENSIKLSIFIWSKQADFGAMVSDFYENTKSTFEKAGIEIPLPQRDIHFKGDPGTND